MSKQLISLVAAGFQIANALSGAELVCETQDLSKEVCEQIACCHWNTSLGCRSSTGSESCETAYDAKDFAPPKSEAGSPITLILENQSPKKLTLWWHDFEGKLVAYGPIEPFSRFNQGTFSNHPWSCSDFDNSDSPCSIDGKSVFIG